MRCRQVSVDVIDYINWRSAFAEAMDSRFYTIDYLDWLISNGRAWFMATPDAAIVVEIKMFPTGLCAVHGLVAAGKLSAIENELIPLAEKWGQANGCAMAIIESRPGWRRTMAKHGYELFQESIVKEF